MFVLFAEYVIGFNRIKFFLTSM